LSERSFKSLGTRREKRSPPETCGDDTFFGGLCTQPLLSERSFKSFGTRRDSELIMQLILFPLV
jgi:hypothetical protein